MLNFVQTNILEMIEMYGEDKCQNILSSFYCPLNHDVEDFLHTKAISFAKQHLAMTFLVFINQNNQLLLVGYYTLANKSLSLSNNIGGNMVYIECASNPKLHYFYSTNGFSEFGKRNADKGLPLVQMVKYF